MFDQIRRERSLGHYRSSQLASLRFRSILVYVEGEALDVCYQQCNERKKQSARTHGNAVNLGEVGLVIVAIESPQPYSERSADRWRVFGVL